MMCSQYMGGAPHKGLGLLPTSDLLSQRLSSDILVKPPSLHQWRSLCCFGGFLLIFLTFTTSSKSCSIFWDKIIYVTLAFFGKK